MLYTFPEYLPDLPAYNNPGMIDAENVIPAGNSYQQAQGLVGIYNAIDAYARGAIGASAPDGTNAMFVGNETKLYRLVGNSWTDVTRISASSTAIPYATASEQLWDFTQFGNHVIATNFADDIQTVDLSNAATTKMTALGGSPPKAKYITTVKDFVMLANIESFPFLVRWSAIGNQASWTISTTTQAGQQELDSQYGPITAIVGGEYAIVFQERAITRLEYVGSPVVFSFATQEINQGTRYPKSVVKVGDVIYYIGIDGFYMFDGHRSHPIGANKVDRTFLGFLDENRRDRVSVSVDYGRQLICWAIPTDESDSGTPVLLLYYNFSPTSKNRWTYVDQTTDLLFTTRSPGYTMDNIGSYLTDQGLSDNIELLPAPLDSDFWKGGTLEFSSFAPFVSGSATSKCKLSLFTGPPLIAKLQTAETEINPGQRTQVQLLQPLVTSAVGGSATASATAISVIVEIGTRNKISDAVKFNGPFYTNSIGQVPCRSNARYHRLQVLIENGFEDAIGVEVLEANPAGYR